MIHHYRPLYGKRSGRYIIGYCRVQKMNWQRRQIGTDSNNGSACDLPPCISSFHNVTNLYLLYKVNLTKCSPCLNLFISLTPNVDISSWGQGALGQTWHHFSAYAPSAFSISTVFLVLLPVQIPSVIEDINRFKSPCRTRAGAVVVFYQLV
jgi:hypothetical protein